MQIIKYIESMLPSLQRSEMTTELEAIRKEMRDHVNPVINRAKDIFGDRKWTSKEVAGIDTVFKNNLKFKYRGNHLTAISTAMDEAYKNIDVIERLVEKNFSSEVYRDAMSVLKVNLVQWIDVLSFASTYALRSVEVVMAMEINVLKNLPPMEDILPKDIQYLDKHRMDFMASLNVIATKSGDVEKVFNSLPDTIATPTAVALIPKTRNINPDPFAFGIIPVKLNPIFHVRMAVAEWQASRYHDKVQTAQMLEFRLIQLEQTLAGKPNAKIEQELEYTRNRRDKIRMKIKEMEDKYVNNS